MRKRIVEYVLPVQGEQSLLARIEQELRWYHNTHYAHLTAFLVVPHDNAQVRAQLEQIIGVFRDRKDSQKPDPNFKILSPAQPDASFVDFLTRLDCRLPKLMLLPHLTDHDNFSGLADSLRSTASLLRHYIIDFRFCITAERLPQTLPALLSELRKLSESPEDRALLSRFPVIEVPFTAGGDDSAQLANALAELWSRWPQLNDSVNLSRGGFVKHFYALKELWHLARIMNQEQSVEADIAKLRTGYGVEAAVEARIAAFDQAFLERYASLGQYNEWRHSSNSVVLEFDLDSIADTYECQSPVFVDNRWILERNSLELATDKGRKS
ncbi:hypothetical protein BHS06_21580 [Myxococcus xanthus]|uniref:hypothetical protein n=1 Tax=Myxococcus xanthus TaxID=34 RepID=UPI00112E4738|nr:hypothetical protein [Myxococcus xanthus]QDE91361.1 hypothetical protein BHS06_21580 [Myxococcus xanthus]